MIITEMLNVDNVTTELKGNTKEEILKELAELVKNGEVLDEELFYQDLLRRENAGSTALENGSHTPTMVTSLLQSSKVNLPVFQCILAT